MTTTFYELLQKVALAHEQEVSLLREELVKVHSPDPVQPQSLEQTALEHQAPPQAPGTGGSCSPVQRVLQEQDEKREVEPAEQPLQDKHQLALQPSSVALDSASPPASIDECSSMINEADSSVALQTERTSSPRFNVLGEMRPMPPAIFEPPSPPMEPPPDTEAFRELYDHARQSTRVGQCADEEPSSGVPPVSPRDSHVLSPGQMERSQSTANGGLCRSHREFIDEVSVLQINPVWLEVGTMSRAHTLGKRNVSGNFSSLSSNPTRMENFLLRSRSALFTKTRKGTLLEYAAYSRKPLQRFAWCPKSCIASPLSKRRLAWDFAGLGLLTYDLIMVPLQAFEPPYSKLVSYVNMMICIFWTGDILASFLVGYYSDGQVEMNPRKIALHYLKSWFCLDVTLVATDWTFLLAGLDAKARFMRLGKVATCMRVLRLLRLMKLHVVVSDITDRIHSEHNRTLMHIGRLLALIVAINHFIACAWYGLHHLRPEDKTWVHYNFVDSDGIGYRYWTSMHWSMTQFTPASMEVVPKNSTERFYTVCVLTFALVAFSSFVSSITQSMTHLRTINARELQQHSMLHRYLNTHSISPQLVNRILHFIRDRSLKKNREARIKITDVELFNSLPESVKMELRSEVFVPVLCVHPLFHNYFTEEPASMRMICKNDISEKTMFPREELFSDHAPLTDAVFMSDGTLAYTFPCQDRETTVHISEGQWVCEVALWANRPESFGPLVAEASSTMILLGAPGFVSMVRRYEVSAKYVSRYAELFVNYVNKQRNGRWARILCNDIDDLRDLVHQAFDDQSGDAECEGGHRKSQEYGVHSVGDAISVMAGIFSRLPGLPAHSQAQTAPADHGADNEQRATPCKGRSRSSSKGSVFSVGSR